MISKFLPTALSFLLLTVATVKLSAQCGLMYEYPNDAVKCTNKDYFYYAPSGFSNYNWTVASGTVTGGGVASTNWVSVKWNQPGYSRTVQATYSFGCFSSFYVTNMPPPPVISGPSTACYNNTSIFSVPAGNTCTWRVVSGASLIYNYSSSGQDNVNFNITWNNNANGYAQIGVKRAQSGSCETEGYYWVYVQNGVGSITGPASANSGMNSDYSIPTPASNITWNVTGGTLLTGQGSSTARINWGCSGIPASVNVTYTTSAGCFKSALLNVALTPVTPLLAPTDGSATSYCFKVGRTFATGLGYSNYKWTISGKTDDGTTQGSNYQRTFTNNSNTFNTQTLPDASVVNLFGNVVIKVRYDVQLNCSSQESTFTMTVNPATVAFKGSATDVPEFCYSDSQNKGAYSTDAGFTNYAWSAATVANVGSGTATSPTAQTTNFNWASDGTGGGGTIPVTVSYLNSTLNCTNTNLLRNGARLRKPVLSNVPPLPSLPLAAVGVPTQYSSAQNLGIENEWSWVINPSTFGRFTDQSGNTQPAGTNATYITWDRNNEPDPFPTVSLGYWIYYPAIGGARISQCATSTQVDLRACNSCSMRVASDIAEDKGNESSEPGVFKAYPTLADNELWLHNVPVGSAIKMISMNGADALSTIQDQENLIKKIDTGNLSSGVYLVKTFDTDNQPVIVRVVVRH